ncbi:MAG TPA: GTP-binding protein, partial [Candidatus Methylomirabilis sp.]
MSVEIAKIRNVGLAGHGSGGKTTLAEALLFDAGATNRLGRVEDGTTVLDHDEDEIKRKITISTAMAFLEWKGHKVNLLDTPGFGNFLADTKICLRVVDTTVIVVPAPNGVQVQTDKVWSYATEYGQARVIYLSKMDRERADFARAVEDVRKNLSAKAVPVQLPIGREAAFAGVVDLIRSRAIRYPADGSGKGKEEDIPAGLANEAAKARAALLEAIAEADDDLLEKYLESGELSEAEARAGLRKGVASGALVPILCGAPARNIAVQPLLDFLVEACPSPADLPPPRATDAKGQAAPCVPRDDAPLVAQVFKTVADPFAGKVTMFRVYSG